MRVALTEPCAPSAWQVWVLSAVIFFWPALPVAAQTTSEVDDHYLIDVWQTDDGLPQNEVTSVAQTPEGYLWIGMFHGGLARFDGRRFTVFNPFNTPEIRANEIQALSVDRRGTLWIGPSDASLTTWSGGNFNQARWEQDTPRLRLDSVVGVYSNQVFLAAVPSAGISPLMAVNTSSNSFAWNYYFPTTNDLPFYCLDHDGVVWFRTAENWLGQLRGDRVATLPRDAGVPGREITAMLADARGQVWVGSDAGIAVWEGGHFRNCNPTNGDRGIQVKGMACSGDGGLWVLENNGRLRKYINHQWVVATQPGALEFKLNLRNFELHGDRDGGLWAVNYGEGLWHILPDGVVHKLPEKGGLPSSAIECWFQDREGNIWLGTTKSGLVRLRQRLFHVLGDSAENNGSIWEDSSGGVWVGTTFGRMNHWEEGVNTPWDLSAEMKAPILEATVCGDTTGRLWIGTVQSGVLVRENGTLRRPFPASEVSDVVRVLFADRQGRMWFGSEFGLACWQDGALKKFEVGENGTPYHVTGIVEDPAGSIWISTASCRLLRFREGTFQVFKSPSSLWKMRFWCLASDTNGGLWIGTLGGGLVRFKEGKFDRVSSQQGLPNDYITQLLDDGQGNLWAGSRGGVFSMAYQDLNAAADGHSQAIHAKLYTRADGLPTIECSAGFQPACWRGRNNRLWFSTVKGVVWVQPQEMEVSSLPPPVLIEEMRVDGVPNQNLRENKKNTEAMPFQGTRHPAKSFQIGPGQHYIEFRFTGLTLAAPDEIRFKWKMEGLDADWVYGGEQRVVGYSSIPPGTYTFQVTACNSDGVWNQAGDSLELTIRPHSWQTWWFKVALALLAAGLIWTIYTIRLARVRALQRERLRIARALHDEVGAGLGTIALLGEFIEQQPTASDGQAVRQMALQTIDSLRDIIWFIDPAFDRMDHLVARLQTIAKARLPGIELNFRPVGDFKMTPLPLTFRRNVIPLFKEALHNIVKHAGARRVEIKVRNEHNEFQLTISDNGSGFDPGKSVAGSGLKNMHRRASEMKGKLEIRRPPAGGTTLRLTVRLP